MSSGVVIKGRIRGGSRPLARYLLAMGENDEIEILYVDGQVHFTDVDFKDLMGDFSLTEKLTRSRQGVYHLTINPPEDVAATMSKDDWLVAADILAEETGFAGQRMGVVRHRKPDGRHHIHVAIERYNHETGKMIPIDHNYRKHLKAGRRIAEVFGLQPLPERNLKRDDLKTELTQFWKQTTDAKGFLQQVKQRGYMISKGYAKVPYMVVDDTGRSFSLSKHLKGIRVKDVQERLKDTVLLEERKAIAYMRTQQTITVKKESKETQQEDPRQAFLENLQQTRAKQKTHKPRVH